MTFGQEGVRPEHGKQGQVSGLVIWGYQGRKCCLCPPTVVQCLLLHEILLSLLKLEQSSTAFSAILMQIHLPSINHSELL